VDINLNQELNINDAINTVIVGTNTSSIKYTQRDQSVVQVTTVSTDIVIGDINHVRINNLGYENINNQVFNNHSRLINLGNDDHPQYLNTSRGDIRYHQIGTVTAHDVEYVPGITVYEKIAALSEEPELLEYTISGGYF
jgi:hypothetical protein